MSMEELRREVPFGNTEPADAWEHGWNDCLNAVVGLLRQGPTEQANRTFTLDEEWFEVKATVDDLGIYAVVLLEEEAGEQ
ncbi:hypothetical protein LCGC14_3047470 [marine sediment metagenome]|uniref:Uncharacterized protein n=1 Tax=marine sediment metagenome TaxID=412755 RepID=A0A0F8ZDL7_9ZZZZ